MNGNTWVEWTGFPGEESSTVTAPRQECGVCRGRGAEAGLGPQEGGRTCGRDSRGAASQYPLAWTLTDPVSRNERDGCCVPPAHLFWGTSLGPSNSYPETPQPASLEATHEQGPQNPTNGSWLFSQPLFLSLLEPNFIFLVLKVSHTFMRIRTSQ